MYFRQFYLGCLAHASYVIGSRGEAVVVDPQRDVDQYIDDAAAQGLTIKFVLETHLHADFVSGHCELAERTGAEIVLGARAGAAFKHRGIHDGEELRVGDVTIRALETPGHTPESISWLVSDGENPKSPMKILTGDTLFIGDVGRPDLAGARGFTPQEMAAMMYESLHQKILTLPDDVEVYPAHGAGSACGRNISRERSSTIGEQRVRNWALRPMSREEFVSLMTSDMPPAPIYFSMDAEINRTGARRLSEVPVVPIGAARLHDLVERGEITVLDVRDPASFGCGHVPGSLNIGLGGEFASWAGTLVAHDRRLALVCDSSEQAGEAITRLARVGLENVEGYLEGGIGAWDEAGYPIDVLAQLDVTELQARLSDEAGIQVVDVRRPGEYAAGHVPRAISLPVQDIQRAWIGLDPSKPLAVICAGGYRSSIASSILRWSGFSGDLFNVIGGTGAWVSAGLEIER